MVAIDYQNSDHLNFFHTWQNDPRVAKGWNESGTLEQHYGYLERMHNDAHQTAILAYFESTPFAYFEVYWAKVNIPLSISVNLTWGSLLSHGVSRRTI
jgi:hypothetical protein